MSAGWQRLIVTPSWIAILILGATCGSLRAHDLERTEVTLSFAPDTAFTLDVTNDPDWLLLRLEPFAAEAGIPGRRPDTAAKPLSIDERDALLVSFAPIFIDRVVLWVDGHEVRPSSAEFIKPRPRTPADDKSPPATYRLSGRMSQEVQSLRWFYGLVVDPYPLKIRRADGRELKETVLGQAWSESLDLAGQFNRPSRREIAGRYFVFGLEYIVSVGVAQLLFVWGLMLMTLRLRPFRTDLPAFLLAQSLGFALTITGVITISDRLLWPAIALSIVYVVGESLLTRRVTASRVALVLVFGLLHGCQIGGGMPSPNLEPSALAAFMFVAAVVLAEGAAAAVGWLAAMLMTTTNSEAGIQNLDDVSGSRF